MSPFPPQSRFEGTPLTALIVGSLCLALAVDYVTALGLSGWILYLLPVTFSALGARPRVPFVLAAIVSILIFAGYLLSPRPLGDIDFILTASRANRATGIVCAWVIAAVAHQLITSKLRLRGGDWVREGEARLAVRLQGEQRAEELGESILSALGAWIDAPVGALYASHTDGSFRLTASLAAPVGGTLPDRVQPGVGLVGQAIRERRTISIADLPSHYFPISSSLGATAPRHVIVVPLIADGEVLGALEFGFLGAPHPCAAELLGQVAEPIAVAIRSLHWRTRLNDLLEETQRQAEELQAQQEELRVANDDLEQHNLALQQSGVALEMKQAELEEANAQLEEQAAALEQQRDALADAQAHLVERADELARANEYKSQFLANMSHELRTPLNSSLLLSKLLTENTGGNLTPEQVRYATTIHAASNDLLALINDILDLARIEARHLSVEPVTVEVATLVQGLVREFEPVAEQKGLRFDAPIAPGTPTTIVTDPLRLQQILRNLLANAFKFTEDGRVVLRVAGHGADVLTFTVQDTGVGIPEDQQEAVFEAFHQASGGIDRKYGGTGLGLTIARELARRLGGTLGLASRPGEGSTFTLELPRVLAATEPRSAPLTFTEPPAVVRRAPAAPPPPLPEPSVEDDRATLPAGGRTLLVVEDDLPFAAILRDLAREQGFACLVATSAAEAIALAERHPPSGVLLDVRLPDESGLTVLEHLKRAPATRHVPVHVVSVSDVAHQALTLGAVGHARKPVQREQLVQAFGRIERRLSQKVRRVLVVEDVAAQREGIAQLVGADDVEVVGVETGAAALEQLRSTSFDCVVLDLTLPDMTGYDVLDRMAAGEAYAFPPVVVYTGRSLTQAEEQRLRRYATSIVIKGARSPERLLDEVTLFLHQMESRLPPEQQRMLRDVRHRDGVIEGRCILVAEDDVRSVFALTSVLEPRGAKVAIARNGREALEVLECNGAGDHGIDLVLMDVMMPEMDGLAAMREIRRRPEWARLPVIALTAKAMPDDRARCLEAGANDYIAKPIDTERLLSLVRVWLTR